MASFFTTHTFVQLLFIISMFNACLAARKLNELVQDQPQLLKYHDGPLLSGKISVNLIWYGKFKPSQRAIISDLINSLSSSSSETNPSVSNWWKITKKYYQLANSKKPYSLSISLGKQIFDESYSLGKSLTENKIVKLASKGEQKNAINVVLTSSNVTVDGFCSSRCGTHGSALGSEIDHLRGNKRYKFAYIWVGNSETQCPGQCAWPFHQPIYGPQSAPLVAPNNDVGVDGMVINLASLLAGTATNPFGNGYFQGPAEAPLEVASACPGVYGKGAYPGYAGDLLVDSTTGASYNANGANGRKYLLPALYDPSTSSCSTLAEERETKRRGIKGELTKFEGLSLNIPLHQHFQKTIKLSWQIATSDCLPDKFEHTAAVALSLIINCFSKVNMSFCSDPFVSSSSNPRQPSE